MDKYLIRIRLPNTRQTRQTKSVQHIRGFGIGFFDFADKIKMNMTRVTQGKLTIPVLIQIIVIMIDNILQE